MGTFKSMAKFHVNKSKPRKAALNPFSGRKGLSGLFVRLSFEILIPLESWPLSNARLMLV